MSIGIIIKIKIMKVGRLLDIGIWNIQAHLGSIVIGLTMGIIIW